MGNLKELLYSKRRSISFTNRLSPGLFLLLVLITFIAIEFLWPIWRSGGPTDVILKYMVLVIGTPFAIALLCGRASLLGLRLGKRPLFYTLLATLPILPFYAGAALLFDSMRSYYPQWAFTTSVPSLLNHFLLISVVIFGTELLFRGFMVLALRDYGRLAVLIHLIPYVYVHIGKPLPEVIASAFAGVYWGLIAYESDSILPSTVSHTLGYFMMDLIIVLSRS